MIVASYPQIDDGPPATALAWLAFRGVDDTHGGTTAYLSLDPGLAVRTAGDLLDEARALVDDVRPLWPDLDLPERVGGTLPAGAAVGAVHEDAVAGVAELVERLGEVLEGDADRLYQVASRLSWADTRAAERFA
jgi:hypothetical protein